MRWAVAFADGRRATTLQPNVPDSLPEGVISEWKPTKATVRAWTILSIPITAVALLGYTLVAVRGDIPVSWSIDSNQILLIVALTLGLGCIHEGVHGIAMLAFGAKPEFGVLKIGRMIGGLYTTAPGHRFGRRQYLILGLAPLVILAPLGVLACLLPFGAYLAAPFAIHFAGCIGDVTIAWHVLKGPPDVVCEDLRDGMRFWEA
jgi:hypothetical protein